MGIPMKHGVDQCLMPNDDEQENTRSVLLLGHRSFTKKENIGRKVIDGDERAVFVYFVSVCFRFISVSVGLIPLC